MPFPPEHVEFYRQTLVRLIQANELASETLNNFHRLIGPIDLPLAA
jgi:hypothetical protein